MLLLTSPSWVLTQHILTVRAHVLLFIWGCIYLILRSAKDPFLWFNSRVSWILIFFSLITAFVKLKSNHTKNSSSICFSIFSLFKLPTSTSHEPESHFYLPSLWGKSHQQVKAYAQRRSDSFDSVRVCTLQIYTTYTYSIFISCRNFTKSLEIKTFKKTYSRILFEQNYTVHVLSRHTRRRAWVLISGRFQEVACDSYCVLTKAVSQHCVARVALLPIGECPMDTVNKARTDTPSAVSDKISWITLVPQLCSDSNHTIIRLTQINCVSAC